MLDCVRSTISGVPLVARAQRAHRRQRNQPARRAPKLAPTSSSIRNRTGSSTLCLGRGDGRRAILLSSILCLRPSVRPSTDNRRASNYAAQRGSGSTGDGAAEQQTDWPARQLTSSGATLMRSRRTETTSELGAVVVVILRRLGRSRNARCD